MPFRTTAPTVLAALILATLPTLAPAQNLVPNPNFDSSLTDWTAQFPANDPLASIALDSNDGSPSAPSMLFTQLQPGTMPDQREIRSGCMPVTPGMRYDFSYDTSRRPIVVASGVDVITYSDTACTTNAANTMPVDANAHCSALTGAWIRCYHHGVLVPTGVVAIKLRVLGILLSANDPPLNQFRIDNVRFGPIGTVPVELQSFELR